MNITLLLILLFGGGAIVAIWNEYQRHTRYDKAYSLREQYGSSMNELESMLRHCPDVTLEHEVCQHYLQTAICLIEDERELDLSPEMDACRQVELQALRSLLIAQNTAP